MNEFLPRTDPVASVARGRERSLTVQSSPGASAAQAKTEAGVHFNARAVDRPAASASYARLRADIANIVADIQPTRAPNDQVAAADDALMRLMPQPVVILPMAPTDQTMVDFVAQVAQSLAQRSAQARAAQANATPILLEAAAN